MRPATRFSRAPAYSSVESKPVRATQACAKTAEAAKLRPSHLEGDAPCPSSPCVQFTGYAPSNGTVSAACDGAGA